MWVSRISTARIAGLNPARDMDVSVFCILFCQGEISASGRSLVQSSPTKCGVSMITQPQQWGGPHPLRTSVLWKRSTYLIVLFVIPLRITVGLWSSEFWRRVRLHLLTHTPRCHKDLLWQAIGIKTTVSSEHLLNIYQVDGRRTPEGGNLHTAVAIRIPHIL